MESVRQSDSVNPLVYGNARLLNDAEPCSWCRKRRRGTGVLISRKIAPDNRLHPALDSENWGK
jgi:hypothetical protein